MGVYISSNEFSLLIDGLHTEYGDDYLFPTEKLVSKITTQLKPDAILFTHHHGDHFSAQLSDAFLKSNEKSVIFGPNQVTKKINASGNRIHMITTEDYVKQKITFENAEVTGLKINHAGKRHIDVENVGYIVTINNTKILHVGDTNWLEEINLFDQLKLSEESIDVAILPYWMLIQDNASALIKKHINPKQVIATHISPRIKKEELSVLKSRYPKTYFLTQLEQQIQL